MCLRVANPMLYDSKPRAEHHGRLDYWKTGVSHCRLPENGAVRHQDKTQRQILTERYDKQRVSSHTLYCNLLTASWAPGGTS